MRLLCLRADGAARANTSAFAGPGSMAGYVHWPEAPAQHVDLNGRYRGYGDDEQYSNYTTKRHKSHPDFLLAVLTIRTSDAMCSAR